MIQGADRWYTVGSYLVQSVKNGLSTAVGRSGQVPGEIAWDECCDGMLAVSTPRIYLSEEFPAEAEGPVGMLCQAPYEVGEFTVLVLRCVPGPEEQGAPPSADDLNAAAAVTLRDAGEMLTSITSTLCALKENDDVSDYFVTPAEAAGPEGLCGGFSVRALVSLERF